MDWTKEEIDAARGATPGTLKAEDESKFIHFNNAGCSLPTQKTLDAVISYLNKEATLGGYETFDASTQDLQRPYTALASLLNCTPDEIAIVTSATEAWQQIVYGLSHNWRPGDRLITCNAEYGSNYISYLQLQKRTGIVIEIIPEKRYYEELDLDALRKMLEQSSSAFSPRVVLVSLNHVPTSSGKVYNVKGVGALTKEFKVPFLVDACQSVGQMPVDVQKINCDFLTGTGRKYLRAPRGSGFLYCSKDAMQYFEPATLDNTGATWTSADTYELRPTARRFERYEMSFAAKVGLGIAVEQCLELGIDRIWHRIHDLARELRRGLENVKILKTIEPRQPAPRIPGRPRTRPQRKVGNGLSQWILARAHLHEPRLCSHGHELCGIVAFTVDYITADELQKELAEAKINTSVSRISSSRLYFEKEELEAVVRASVHYYNTEEEIATFVKVVDRIAKQRYEASKL